MAPPSACAKCRRELKGCCAGALRLRRGRKPTTRRPRRRRAPGGVDRIGALPDDLLLEVLVRLRCARAAAHATLLARRWRGLWAGLPELAFHGVAPDPLDAALAAASTRASAPLSLLSIAVPYHHSPVSTTRLSSWLRAAAALAPARLVISNAIMQASRGVAVVELPRFDRTTSISLEVSGARFTLPPAGDLPALESLSLDRCHIDLSDLLPRCPRLRKLRIYGWELNSITVRSPSLEELDVEASYAMRGPMHLVHIVTPVLKKLRFFAHLGPMTGLGGATSLTCTAPMVEELHWWCTVNSKSARFGVWWLRNLTLTAKPSRNTNLQLQHRPHVVHTLSLRIGIPIVRPSVDEAWNFGKEITSRIPVTKFQGLELEIETEGHVYGAMVLHLLGICNFIQRLRLNLREVRKGCSVNCPCNQLNNWKSQSISLTYLQEVEIHGFQGEDHEVDLLNVIFTSATMLERVAVHSSSKISPRDNGCMEMYSISMAYPSVKCKFYHDTTYS
ncbi:hypothetical protein ACP70R_023065 [Stipagrostis hirtigluma subsp. patula]